MALLSAAFAIPDRAHGSCPSFATPRTADEAVPLLPPEGFVVRPRSGRVPLEVRMLWWSYPVADPVRFEIEIDGALTWSDADDKRRAHVFTQPGLHIVTGRMTDRAGRVVTAAVSVDVRSETAFDAELSARWATFRAAVARGDVAQALECVQVASRDRARTALISSGPLVREFLGHGDTLIYHGMASSVDLEYLTDEVNGGTLLIVFGPDMDGVWRIDGGGW